MCHVDVPMDIRSWRTIKDVQALLRELDIRKVITDAQLTALDRPDSRKTRFSKDLKTCMWISQHKFVRQGLYKVGQDLTVVQNSDSMYGVHKVSEQTTGYKRKTKLTMRSLWVIWRSMCQALLQAGVPKGMGEMDRKPNHLLRGFGKMLEPKGQFSEGLHNKGTFINYIY